MSVADQLNSCKSTISSSLHGLILSDLFGTPNVWLDPEGKSLSAGGWKFDDYFESQGRPFGENAIFIEKPEDLEESKLYRGGNKIDLEKLRASFPFA